MRGTCHTEGCSKKGELQFIHRAAFRYPAAKRCRECGKTMTLTDSSIDECKQRRNAAVRAVQDDMNKIK